MIVGNVLVVYALHQYPVRDTIRDHLYSFERYSRHRCFYLNLLVRRIPAVLNRVDFDAVIFHTTFLSMRWSSRAFEELVARAQPLKDVGGIRVAIPQDEFLQSAALSAFIDDFDVGYVFTAAARSEWPKIYATVDQSHVKFTTVLTGYLEGRSVSRMGRIAEETGTKPVDICYRAWHAAPWLGRHGLLKSQVAEAFMSRGAERGLRLDISTREEDTLYGDDWYRLLASSKYTIGVEGGASVLDRDGSVKAATERYVAAHPDASFDEIEANCFPERDGELRLFAISPRHLEACATRTCQILVEGAYNGVLRAGEHYIELRRDLSNLDDVLDQVQRDDRREAITSAAWRDVVASGRYSYRTFVETVEHAAIPARSSPAVTPWFAVAGVRALDRLSWAELPIRVKVIPRVVSKLAVLGRVVLPDFILNALRRRSASVEPTRTGRAESPARPPRAPR